MLWGMVRVWGHCYQVSGAPVGRGGTRDKASGVYGLERRTFSQVTDTHLSRWGWSQDSCGGRCHGRWLPVLGGCSQVSGVLRVEVGCGMFLQGLGPRETLFFFLRERHIHSRQLGFTVQCMWTSGSSAFSPWMLRLQACSRTPTFYVILGSKPQLRACETCILPIKP